MEESGKEQVIEEIKVKQDDVSLEAVKTEARQELSEAKQAEPIIQLTSADRLKLLRNYNLGSQHKKILAETRALISSEMPANEKIKILIEKLSEQIPISKMKETECKNIKNKYTNMSREKESIINELSSERERRKNLENYCREMQKQNRQIQEECKIMSDEETKKREELTNKLNTALLEVTTKFEENEQERVKQHLENETLKVRMQELGSHAMQRDEEYQGIIMQKDLEIQLCKVQLEYKSSYKETELKSQLDLYRERYDEFTSTIDKSNTAFDTIRHEVKKVNDRLQSEIDANKQLRKQKEKADIELVTLLTDKNDKWKKEIAELKARQDAIKAECNQLYAEKKARQAAESPQA